MKTDTQQAQDASKNEPLPSPSGEEKSLNICLDIIGTYKQIIAIDEPGLEKLVREMTKCFITASSIVRRLNRIKKG